MRKQSLILLVLLLSMVTVVYADVPTVTDVKVEAVTDGNLLTLTIRHSGPSSAHYVNKIEYKIGEAVSEVSLEPQTVVTFTEELEVSGDVVEVRAYCTLHGWSQWKTVEGDAEPEPEPSGGIPGFPLLAIGLGLGLVALRRDG